MKHKVFGGLTIHNGKQVRTIVAANSQAKAAELVGVGLTYLREYWSVTGNCKEIEIALAKPNTVFISLNNSNKEFVELVK